jgi:hypothetical protein
MNLALWFLPTQESAAKKYPMSAAKAKIAGAGRKRPQLNINIERLMLDSENPRLPASAHDKSQSGLLDVLFRDFDLDQIAGSLATNGYLDEEPLVVIPEKLPAKIAKEVSNGKLASYTKFINNPSTVFIVVEGNRRLSTAKILLINSERSRLKINHWPGLTEQVRADLSVLPCIVYPTRSEVMPYLGVRHIVGIKKWESYARARYISKMVENSIPIDTVESQIGGDPREIRLNCICYYVLEQAREHLSWDTKAAESDFSLLLVAVGLSNLKGYLGMPTKLGDVSLKEPVPSNKMQNLRNLLSWLFGEGSKVMRVIKESRDITQRLSHVVVSNPALEHLLKTRDLAEAYELSDGEESMVRRGLANANRGLEKVLGVVHRHKTPEVIGESEKCYDTAKRLLKTVKE